MSFKKNGRQIKLRELLTDITYAWNLVIIKCYHPKGYCTGEEPAALMDSVVDGYAFTWGAQTFDKTSFRDDGYKTFLKEFDKHCRYEVQNEVHDWTLHLHLSKFVLNDDYLSGYSLWP